MSTTIAYNHKGGYWKTRYSFFASFMKSVGRRFFSSPSRPIGLDPDDDTVVDHLVWQHNSDSDTNRTNFYGSVGGSGISVSFNDNVSSNKIYKSFSLEGTNNISGVNTFVVNSDNSPDKQFSMGPIKDKGGILYGHIGLSNLLLDGSNIEAIGTIEQTNLLDSTGLIVPAGNYNLKRTKSAVKNKCKYILMDGQGTFYNMAGAQITFNPGSSYFTSDFLEPFNLNIFEGTPFLQFLPVEGAGGYSDAFDTFEQYLGPIQGSATLLEITPQNINGTPPRGQYAQADIALGSAPYELFSLNVNYEPTDLDHSK
jgi:hypothetical protein